MPKKTFSMFDEFDDDERIPEFLTPEETLQAITRKNSVNKRNDKRSALMRSLVHNVEANCTLTPELLAAREELRSDYVKMHQTVFPNSTGQKPFGEEQNAAIRRFQRIVQSRGKLVQAEPRGFAKTSRAVNQLLIGILTGDIKFALIVSSAIDKSQDIMDQLQTELLGNFELEKYFPVVLKCFQATEGKAFKASRQTLNDEPTHIDWSKDSIRFPHVPGEPSSGAVILVRTKDNLRGISRKIRYGPEAGKVIRPDFVLIDDIQTDKEATSPTVSQKIIRTIKRSVLFGGSHSKKIRAVMTITPNVDGDVATHFILNEPSWEVALYPMIKTMPKNMDLWEEYAAILLNFDRRKEGDREKAQRRAAEFVKTNFDALHEGAQATWEYAYEWDTDDPIELSAVHHAMTFYFEEGEEAFNFECQCKVERKNLDEEVLKASHEQIVTRISHLPRRMVPAHCKYLVTHVDCNADILTYLTMASDQELRPYVVDYGTYPPQPGVIWKKGKIIKKLESLYPDIEREDFGNMMYAAIRDFGEILANTIYKREDGHELLHRYIAFDTMWQTDDILRAIRESRHRSLLLGTQGLFYGVKDRPMMEQVHGDRTMHFHCFSTPSTDRVVELLKIDTNAIKTLVHRGYISRSGTIGTLKLFIPENPGDHQQYADHLCSESPETKTNVKENRIVVEWTKDDKMHDNEYFDNTVGAMALLIKAGCTLKARKEVKKLDMNTYIQSQK
jgi:hypothetical protein